MGTVVAETSNGSGKRLNLAIANPGGSIGRHPPARVDARARTADRCAPTRWRSDGYRFPVPFFACAEVPPCDLRRAGLVACAAAPFLTCDAFVAVAPAPPAAPPAV